MRAFLFDVLPDALILELAVTWCHGEDVMALQCVLTTGTLPNAHTQSELHGEFAMPGRALIHQLVAEVPHIDPVAAKVAARALVRRCWYYVTLVRSQVYRFNDPEYHRLTRLDNSENYLPWFETAHVAPRRFRETFYHASASYPWLSNHATNMALIVSEDQLTSTIAPIQSVTTLNLDATRTPALVFPSTTWPAVCKFSWRAEPSAMATRTISLTRIPNVTDLTFRNMQCLHVFDWHAAPHLQSLTLMDVKMHAVPTEPIPTLQEITASRDAALLRFACTVQAPWITQLTIYIGAMPADACVMPKLRVFKVRPEGANLDRWFSRMPNLETLHIYGVNDSITGAVPHTYPTSLREIHFWLRDEVSTCKPFPTQMPIRANRDPYITLRAWMAHRPPNVAIHCLFVLIGVGTAKYRSIPEEPWLFVCYS